MKKIIFCLIVCSLFSLASCNNESLGEKISFEEANQIISNYSITEIHSFSLSTCFFNKTKLYLDENSIVSTESNFYGNSFAADNEDGFINGNLVKEKVVYFDELNNETLGWFNVGDIQSVSRAVNLMNENCKFNFFDKFEAVTKTSYSLELDDIYYKFFDADLFTYTREITIGHHSNLVDFIQVLN